AQANLDGTQPYGDAAKAPGPGRTTAVGSYPPNAWGLFDMHGNVREWCRDWYDAAYYAKSPKVDPPGPDPRKADRPLQARVHRGGSWKRPGARCRTACRNGARPELTPEDVGFRVVMTVGPTSP